MRQGFVRFGDDQFRRREAFALRGSRLDDMYVAIIRVRHELLVELLQNGD